MSRGFTVFRIEETVKTLWRAFVENYFSDVAGISVKVPEIRGYQWSEKPEDRLIRISEMFGERTDNLQDGFPEAQFPLVLITYPEFNESSVGIGSMVNKSSGYFISNKDSGEFLFDDIINRKKVKLSYKTKVERNWLIRRFYYTFNVNFDIVADTVASRNELSNLIRVMMDQYIAELTEFRDLSRPFVLRAYQYETDEETISFRKHGIERFYPPFFPYGEIIINPTMILNGTGDYDDLEVFGDQKLFVSSFSMEGLWSEAFQLIETRGFMEGAELNPEETVDLSFIESV